VPFVGLAVNLYIVCLDSYMEFTIGREEFFCYTPAFAVTIHEATGLGTVE
jgi:hypothetical protein